MKMPDPSVDPTLADEELLGTVKYPVIQEVPGDLVRDELTLVPVMMAFYWA